MSKAIKSAKAVETEIELEQWLEKSSSTLLLFDVHLDWTGRCETLIPQLDALYRTIDRSEARLKVLSLEVPKLGKKFQSMVELSPSCTNSLSLNDTKDTSNDSDEGLNSLLNKKSCSPLFLAVKGRKVLSIVRGANFPALSKLIQEHIPSISDDDDIVEDS
jgi:hypothetical protein